MPKFFLFLITFGFCFSAFAQIEIVEDEIEEEWDEQQAAPTPQRHNYNYFDSPEYLVHQFTYLCEDGLFQTSNTDSVLVSVSDSTGKELVETEKHRTYVFTGKMDAYRKLVGNSGLCLDSNLLKDPSIRILFNHLGNEDIRFGSNKVFLPRSWNTASGPGDVTYEMDSDGRVLRAYADLDGQRRDSHVYFYHGCQLTEFHFMLFRYDYKGRHIGKLVHKFENGLLTSVQAHNPDSANTVVEEHRISFIYDQFRRLEYIRCTYSDGSYYVWQFSYSRTGVRAQRHSYDAYMKKHLHYFFEALYYY